MEITDRIFLAHYSLDAIAAAIPGGLTAFLFISFFIGVAVYLNVFIAQYTGAGEEKRVGSALWQGIYFSLLAGLIMTLMYFVAAPLFRFSGHVPEVQRLEVIYFRVLCVGSGLNILGIALSCFFMGRGQTRPVMLVNLAGMLFNIPLNCALINGMWGFPELGIAGAGIGTVTSWGLMLILYCVLIFNRENDRRFGVWRNRKIDRGIFLRLMKFGVPGAIQFSMDIFAFTFFVLMVGRIGKVELAVTNIVLSINSLTFMPMMGFSMGTSTLVGQALGRNRPDDAVAVTRSTLHIIYIYIGLMAAFFLFVPEWALSVFQSRNQSPAEYAAIQEMGIVLLRFVAVYIFFDAQYTTYVGALKGAGDTRFIMWSIGILSLAVMVLPICVGIEYFGCELYYAWSCCTLFVFSLFAVSLWRYLRGEWKTMRVIEQKSERVH
ncbi:MATE family efflux transporter [Desulfonema ishimotonii]|uniref:Multidrug-efflux transporter n=2 Tax=Desulfonema ishimotonii TaxID=45657 RepID=A0A401FTI2_9BACT|nr:MATE family efflux transporter [Desulfonema ishimotonii]